MTSFLFIIGTGVFFLHILISVIDILFLKEKVITGKQIANNITTGIINKIIETASAGILGILVFTFLYVLLSKYIYIFPFSWYSVLVCLVASDFIFYVYHYLHHKIKIFWRVHFVHHSDTLFNFSTTFRASFLELTYQWIFFIPLIFLGFHPITIFVATRMIHIYQIFLHTEHIKKLPNWYEFIFITPSLHRVHHGSNAEYLDKNFGGVLTIWDRLFKTHILERNKVIYGIKNYSQKNLMKMQTDSFLKLP
jgi:sterol desaturase/sphingolipid hydroxylase (fatty acid hydroxylase superfamily)